MHEVKTSRADHFLTQKETTLAYEVITLMGIIPSPSHTSKSKSTPKHTQVHTYTLEIT